MSSNLASFSFREIKNYDRFTSHLFIKIHHHQTITPSFRFQLLPSGPTWSHFILPSRTTSLTIPLPSTHLHISGTSHALTSLNSTLRYFHLLQVDFLNISSSPRSSSFTMATPTRLEDVDISTLVVDIGLPTDLLNAITTAQLDLASQKELKLSSI